jgi:Fe2+ transport system protein B
LKWKDIQMIDKLKNLVSTVAPALGSALGSPLGGAAISMIADKLGVPNNQQAVEKAVRQATPDEMLKLKEADNEFEVKMKELEVDVFRLEAEDKQNARATFSKDWTTKLMGILTLSGFMGYIFLVTLQPPEQNSEALINLVLGYLGGLASAVISFYFGASQSKDD